MADRMELRQASVTVASLAVMFCGQPGISDAFVAWALKRAEEMSTPEMAMWIADLKPEFMPILGEDLARLLEELIRERRRNGSS